MSLFAFISNIWTALSPPPPTRRGRRPRAFLPEDTIEPINHWFPGNRNRKEPRRLVETPNADHFPLYRVAKSVVSKRRKRCPKCGSLVKEEELLGLNLPPVKTSRRKSALLKAVERRAQGLKMKRTLRGRIVEYA